MTLFYDDARNGSGNVQRVCVRPGLDSNSIHSFSKWMIHKLVYFYRINILHVSHIL